MRSLVICGLVASAAIVATPVWATADSARKAAPDWGPVSTVPLRPPVATPLPPMARPPIAVQAPALARPAIPAPAQAMAPPQPAAPRAGSWTSNGWSADARPAAAPPPPPPPVRQERIVEGRLRDGDRWQGDRDGRWRDHGARGRGYFVPRYWNAPQFYVDDWRGYGLSDPGFGRNWVRYYDEAMLVDDRGEVYDRRDGIDWERYDHGPVPHYVGRDRGDYPGQRTIYAAPGTVTTIVIQSAPVVTTTTYETVSYVVPRKVWRPRTKRIWAPRTKLLRR